MVERRDRLPNLQLLEGLENISKSDTLPAAWARNAYPTDDSLKAYQDRNSIPRLAESVEEFETTYEERRAALAIRIADRLIGPGGAGSARQDISVDTGPSARATIADALAEPDPEE